MSAFVGRRRVGHFSEAARRLSTAKSIISQRIQQLEKRLGCTLLKPRRPLQLTGAGQRFFGQCRVCGTGLRPSCLRRLPTAPPIICASQNRDFFMTRVLLRPELAQHSRNLNNIRRLITL
ncbi:LysR family transcriptional regulator [Burkholderia sp. MSMB1459WGS]|uniref:LysR family transcriptional regulator n=1 Tax=Burkholderia sp. MSMB1459WGS TaxID=1637970 RepID=UPI001C54CB54|nr:LysR family transcriptional regulator [Burkholderia sp. MSMB1459WGS]